jgi:hypothetical protein
MKLFFGVLLSLFLFAVSLWMGYDVKNLDDFRCGCWSGIFLCLGALVGVITLRLRKGGKRSGKEAW